MKQEAFNKAQKVQNAITYHNLIMDRLNNEKGHFQISFGLSIREDGHFMNITEKQYVDGELLESLKQVTKIYCEKKLSALKQELDGI